MREVTATVLENKRIADEIYSLTFATEEEIRVRPGQFVMVGVGGFPLRRPIAVCKAEGDRVTVCYRLKGAGTRTLARDYRLGEKLSVLMPEREKGRRRGRRRGHLPAHLRHPRIQQE